jgi:general secretion pathway protein M
MMSLDRSALERAGALAILLVLFLVLWLGPVGAYLDFIGQGGDEIVQKSALLQRYRALADAAPAQPVAPARTDASLLIPAVPDAQALAVLQETIKSAAAAAQVQIQGMQVLRGEGEAGALRIGVRVRAAGDVNGLGRLLYAIEAARPVLYPENLQIQAQATAPGAPPSPLQFQLDIAAFKAGTSS